MPFEWMSRLFQKGEPTNPDDFRSEFLARYHNFKLLLKANTQALEAMTQVEEAQQGSMTFGFAFIRSRMTQLSVHVFAMIRHLHALAPGRYQALIPAFETIRARIEEDMPAMPPHVEGRFTAALSEIDRNDTEECGGKMSHLGELRNRMGLAVPDGFVVTATSCHRFLESAGLQADIDQLILTAPQDSASDLQILSAAIAKMIIEADLPDEIRNGIHKQYTALCERVDGTPNLAVRSSALGEDEPGASFAGQYASILNVHRDNLEDAYKQVVAALYGAQALSYRQIHGYNVPAMCVGFLVMIDAAVGGVVYTRDPVSEITDCVLINSAWGRPKKVVDGDGHVDRYLVRRDDLSLAGKTIASKTTQTVPTAQEGVCVECVPPELEEVPSLSDHQVEEVARLSLSIEEHFGYPQDIEFAVDKNDCLILLQTRGVMVANTRPALPVPDDAEILYSGGVRASGGVAAGAVHVVRKNADALTFSNGDVLVVRQPTPDLAVLLPNAAAVVAEQGGVAGHLATVSREFNIPALFGVDNATQLLVNGMEITVDGDGLRLIKGRIGSMLEVETEENAFMLGSPVHQALTKVSRHVVPLNLVNPDSVHFRASNCTTYHDITRFCHEKGVTEMFSFGKGRSIPFYEAKQLHDSGNPKQFWVVNLQDAFLTEPEDKWIDIKDIGSVPMRALWDGMHAIPWEGPPPVDGRGFLNVLFEATVNPNLNVGGEKSLAFKNYFLVSKQFCSLQSRFGFHFCSVETIAGEHAIENYVGFRFFGGAAGEGRRKLRVRFIGELLDEFGFRSRIWDDSLSARIEGQDLAYTVSRLHVLGYIIMHTRQLDMIMDERSKVLQYREKMLEDIHTHVLRDLNS